MNDLINLKSQLKRQIDFLQRSCKLYDEGNEDEAIRIATSLRVLMYDTKTCNSLFKLMGVKERITLLSTCREIGEDSTFAFSPAMTTLTNINGGTAYFKPKLGGGPTNEYVEVSKWCKQVLYVLSKTKRISRADIFLTAANNDGGAHVDLEKLIKDNLNHYIELSSDGALGHFQSLDGISRIDEIKNAHFVALRQMGYEILNSPQLLEMT